VDVSGRFCQWGSAMSAVLVVVVALALAPGNQGANELIARLGAPRFADREAAASALEALGRAALPSLQAARQHPDLEIRSRVNGLVIKIEGALLLEPTPVRLDFQDRPVEEVIPEIARRAGIPLVYNVRGPSRMITLLSERPVPFWEALDRLCEAGGLGYAFNPPNGSNLNNRALLLAPGFEGMGGRRSDHGPFRVNLIGLHYERNLVFVGGPDPLPTLRRFAPDAPPPVPPVPSTDGRLATEQFVVRIQAASEPHLSVRQTGPLKLTAAADDLGRSLLPTTASAPTPYGLGNPGVGINPLQFAIALKLPPRPGQTIRLLRGSIPVSVSTRRPDPLVVPLAAASGKTFRNQDATIVVHDARAATNANQLSIELTVTPDPSRLGSAEALDAELDPMMFRSDVGQLQIELTDAAGHLVSWFPSSNIQNGEETRLTIITIPSPTSPGVPTTLRYFGSIRTAAEIPFEFRDVPMP
jgi:hypothetical protein